MLCDMWASSTALAITAEDKAELERIVRSERTEQRHALRARIILGAAEGRSNNALAKELKTSRPTVVDWRARYVGGGVKALYEDRPRGKSFAAVARWRARGARMWRWRRPGSRRRSRRGSHRRSNR